MEELITKQNKTCCIWHKMSLLWRTLFLGLLLTGFCGSVVAQISVTGTVTDNSGETLPGVNVMIKGTNTGRVTDFDGKYAIEVPNAEAVLVFSFMGYNTIETTVGNRRVIDVKLPEDTKQLEEVVVVGYGVMKKENLTGAVVSVNVEKTLGSRPIADVGRGLQGSVPGMSVTLPSGEIGSDPLMKIRGQVASPNGSANPLILLDNVEIPSIQIVNPDDIESISVLKDAASASIYGAKAAFGVILITTKKGARTESVSVTYSNNFSWQDRAKELKMAKIDGLQYTWDAAKTRNPEAISPPITAGNFWRVNEESLLKVRKWQEEWGGKIKQTDPYVFGRDWYYDGANKFGYRLFDPIEALVANWTPTMTHNLSINGKSGKTMYNIGLGMLDQSGMVKPAAIDDFRRYNASLSVTSEINKYITITAGSLYSDRNKRYPSVGSNTGGDPWLYAYRWGPMFPVGCKDQFGRVMRTADQDFIQTTTSSLRNIYSQINLGTTINFTKDWNLEFNYTHSTQENITEYSIPLFAYADSWVNNANLQQWYDENGERVYVDENGQYLYSSHTDDKGNSVRDGMQGWTFGWLENWRANNAYAETSSISRYSRLINSNTYNLLTRYHLVVQKKHDFNFLAGMKVVESKWAEHFARRTVLTDYDNPQFNFATGEQTVSGNAAWDAEAGFFGRINYAFDNKYLLEGNLYYGGSSKFPGHLRWKTFPSFSAGWVVTQESFMESAKQFLSFAKLRASWGQLGDQTVNNNLYVPEINNYTTGWLGSSDLLLSYRAPTVVSSDIKWQTIETVNLGFDTRFWRNRIGVTFECFQRTTKDMIISGDALPVTFGAGAPQGNYGDLRSRGWEIVVDYNHRLSNGLGISVLATLFDAVIKTTKGADYRRPWEERSIGSTYATGARYGDVWGYISDGLYQEGDFVKDPKTVSGLKKTTIVIEGVSKESYELTGKNPVYQTRLEDGGGVVIFRPGDCKFKDVNGDGYITPGNGTFGNPGDRKVIGNTTPRYEYGVRVGLDYKGFDFSIFVQGIGSRQIWGSGPLAIPGWYTADGSMPQVFAGNYWRPDRTDAFYPRAWDSGQGNTNYSLQQQSKYILNMAYTRIKNITFGYTLPPALTKQVFVKKARVYASFENFFTFDNLRGMPVDPETVTGYSMFVSGNNANLGRTGVGTPTFKSASVGCQISF